MAENNLQLLTATLNRQGVFDGYNVNGVQYDTESQARGWHVTVFPGSGDPINIYWVADSRFYAAKVHFNTEQACEVRLEIFDEVFYLLPAEKHAVRKAIAEWEQA